MNDHLVETWLINDRINRYCLDAIPSSAFDAVAASKGRTVAEQFAHLHNVRLMWLKEAAPDLLDGLEKIAKTPKPSAKVLGRALERSGQAVALLIRRSMEAGGRVKGFKPHVTAFVGYLIAHEAHHRGQIVLILKESGQPLDRKVAYGIWEWGTR